MGMRNFAWGKLLASALIWLTTAIAAPAWAQSACTAMYGINGAANTANTKLAYYNFVTNQWINVSEPFSLNGGAISASGYNALSGSPTSGLLFYVDRTSRNMFSLNINTVPPTETSLGIIPALPVANANTNILGSHADSTGRVFVYATDALTTPATPVGYVAEVNPTNGSLLNGWATVTYAAPVAAGTRPTLGGSGDMYCDAANVCYIFSNTATNPTRYTLNFTPGPSFGQVNSPGVVITGAANFAVAGVAVNPTTQQVYFGNTTTFNISGTTSTAVSTLTTPIVDMGNCIAPPAKPTITKTFGSPYNAASPGTTTVVLTIGNSNTAPLYLFTDLNDVLPAGMVVANPSGLVSTCSSISGTPTATVGSSTVTFATGGRIPQSPGCSITFNVSATASVSAYTNTIPAGALTTSAGTNTVATSATYRVGTDFSATKSQCAGICGTPVTTTVSLGSGQTMQYVLTIANSSVGGTGSATFTDTLPAALTPVISITAGAIGGGTCTTATAVVGGATQISGTFANAPAGAQCLITVTSLVSAQASANTVTNTLTVATTAGTSDTNPANNTAAVLTNLGPATLLTITKTNNTTTVAAGSTTSYTITVANFGPANAPSSIIKDPAATGLTCTAATCAVTAGTATCPAGTPAALMLALQGAGASIPTFNSGSTVSFVVTCGVTATGQ
jgi:uncharacterized repeat protein (TIGR01451 family)